MSVDGELDMLLIGFLGGSECGDELLDWNHVLSLMHEVPTRFSHRASPRKTGETLYGVNQGSRTKVGMRRIARWKCAVSRQPFSRKLLETWPSTAHLYTHG
jgi:hypothetical protein